jgi:hypothetical protein
MTCGAGEVLSSSSTSLEKKTRALIAHVMGSREEERSRQHESISSQAEKKRILVLNNDPAKRTTDLELIVSDSGFPITKSFQRGEDIISEFTLHGADAVMLWYDEGNNSSVSVIEHLLEQREQTIPKIIMVYPGQSALNALVQQNAHIFFDALIEFTRNRAQWKVALEELFAETKLTKNSTTNQLRHLRQPDISLQEAKSISKDLGLKPGKRYWSKADLIPVLLRETHFHEALAHATELQADFPLSFDAIVLEHQVRRAANPQQFNAMKLAKDLESHKNLTVIRAYRAAQFIYKWRQRKALEKLLTIWANSPSMQDDHHYWFIKAQFFRLANQPLLERKFLFAAIKSSPLSGVYLTACAINLADSNDFASAIELLRIALESCVVDRRKLTLFLCRYMVSAGQAERV